MAELPEPRQEWEAANWILTAIGDSHFLSQDYPQAKGALSAAMHTPDAWGAQGRTEVCIFDHVVENGCIRTRSPSIFNHTVKVVTLDAAHSAAPRSTGSRGECFAGPDGLIQRTAGDVEDQLTHHRVGP